MTEKAWRTLGQRYLYRSPWCSFRVDDVALPSGEEIEYAVLESGGFVAVVPVTDDGDVVLVEQWRQPLGALTLELPSGGVDPGEDAAEAAGRELFEETGFRAENLQHLTSAHVSTGRSTERCHVFACRAVEDERGPRPEPTEFIRVVRMPLGDAVALTRDGRISDMATVLGLMWATGAAGSSGI